MPKTGGSPAGFHSKVVRKLPSSLRDRDGGAVAEEDGDRRHDHQQQDAGAAGQAEEDPVAGAAPRPGASGGRAAAGGAVGCLSVWWKPWSLRSVGGAAGSPGGGAPDGGGWRRRGPDGAPAGRRWRDRSGAQVSARPATVVADLGVDLGRDRGVAGLGEELLAVLGGGVGQEGLDGGQGVGLVALVADDLVGDQDDRVGALGLGGVVAGPAPGPCRCRRPWRRRWPWRRSRGGLDRGGGAGVDVDRGDAAATWRRRARSSRSRRRPASPGRRRRRSRTRPGRPGPATPCSASYVQSSGAAALEVLGEVVRGAGVVRAVEGLDRGVGQLGAGVQLRRSPGRSTS